MFASQWVVLALACSATLPGPGPAGVRADTGARRQLAPLNVLLVLADTLRADHLPAGGYTRDTAPALWRLAEDSVVFTAAQAPGAWTVSSVASAFTGVYPPAHGSTGFDDGTWALPEDFDTIAERFRAAGYDTEALLKSEVLTEDRDFSQGFRTWARVDGEVEYGESGRQLREAAVRLLPHLDRPFLFYVHFMDPHDSYMAPEPWYQVFDDAGDSRFTGAHSQLWALYKGDIVAGSRDVRHLRNLYDGEIAYFDAQLGMLLRELDEQGLADSTIVVVMADHGEQLDEHGGWLHDSTWQEVEHVPLMVRCPGARPRLVSTPVSLVDLPDTLGGLVGIPPAQPDQGEDLSGTILRGEDPPGRYLPSWHEEWQALLSPAGMKLVVQGDQRRLYDLVADPGETDDLGGELPGLLEDMADRLDQLTRESLEIHDAWLGEDRGTER